MGFLHSGSSSSGQAPNYTGLQLQTSVSTLPVPLGWGKYKLAPNIIWYANFQRHNHRQHVGKGGGGSVSSVTYSADVILGLCEGQIVGIGQIWKDDTVYNNLGDVGLSLFAGSNPQAVWGYLTSNYPSQALSYPSTAYLCAANYGLGSSASLPSHNFEVIGKYSGTGANGVDADPALVIFDALTNIQYSPLYPVASINQASLFSSADAATIGDAACQTYWRAVGLCFSPILTSVETFQSILQRWQKILNIAVFDSGGLLTFVPYGDQPVTGNGVTYTPNMTPVFDLDDDDFQLDQSNADPLTGQITDIYEAYNVERLTVSDRSNAYNSTPIDARDEAAVNNYGLRIDTSVSATEICDVNVAAISAQLVLQRQLYVRNTYPIRLDARYCGLDPMDILTLTDAAMGMAKVLVRIQEIEENDDGTLTVTVEEVPEGVGTATAYPKSTSTASGALTSYKTASPVNPPIIFEPPAALTGGTAQIWVGASGGVDGVADPLWAGAEVYLSLDDVSYSYLGQINAACRQGVLVSPVTAYATSGLVVDLTQSGGTLSSASSSASIAGTVSYLGGEIINFETALLSGAEQYTLSGVQRGQDNSTPAAHPAGTQFARLDNAFFTVNLPTSYIGKTVWVKLASFNDFGAGLQDLSDCVAYAYTPCGPAVLGAVGELLAMGVSVDLGFDDEPFNQNDDFGLVTDNINLPVDLGVLA